ncbi:hypothetical protein AURDEDRAFT_159091 [Auricularia subglabra TFB-10046 SS5]|nr:hypothetical protein AURDEDRAFT_159091 [Auricularia subglabra TFB-10046 SS5]
MPTPPTRPDTPIRKDRRPQVANLLANAEHDISENSLTPTTMDGYVDLALASFPRWRELAANAEIRAARRAVLSVAPVTSESASYGPTTKLLNLVSLSIFDACSSTRSAGDSTVACIFASNPNKVPVGDIFNTKIHPDYPSYFATREELVSATTHDNHELPSTVAFPEVGSVGEQKKNRGRLRGTGQFKTYMTVLQSYRPDLPTVFGILVNRKYIQLSQLNACGMWSSGLIKLYRGSSYPGKTAETDEQIADGLAPWFAFVFLVYQSFDKRDKKLRFHSKDACFVRWDVFDGTGPLPQEKFAVTPFYSAKTPGRGTFAAFQVTGAPMTPGDAQKAFYNDVVKGFWKTSWQQSRLSNERQILDRLHGPDRWIPGLVRAYPLDDDSRLVIPSPDDIVRQASLTAVDVPDDGKMQDSTDEEWDGDGLEDWGDLHGPGDESEITNGQDVDDVRLSSTADDSSNTVSTENSASAGDDLRSVGLRALSASNLRFVERTQEIIHIASIGEPLSQCETPRELLYTFYDLLETYDHLWAEDVIHRDVSWFNVMCKPRHYFGGNPETQDRPCIRKLMKDAGYSDGLPPVSSVLLADLDHAVDMKEAERHSQLRERTGTPMFISVELSDFAVVAYRTIHHTALDALREALTRVEKHPSGPALLQTAFPDDNDNFLSNLNAVILSENERTKIVWLDKRPIHNPRHDAESAFWVYLWAFLRAQPLRGRLETRKMLRTSSEFSLGLLNHEIGSHNGRSDAHRAGCFMTPESNLRKLFYPACRVFEEMFIMMATYLQVPWHLYPFVQANHAQIAFRRIIFGVLLTMPAAKLDLALNTARPRLILEPWTHDSRKKSTATNSSASGTGRDNDGDKVPMQDESIGRPAKRKASESAPAGTGSASKKRVGFNRQPIPANAAPKDPADDIDISNAASRYSHGEHLQDRTAFGLRLKVWKDRTLWFSSSV